MGALLWLVAQRFLNASFANVVPNTLTVAGGILYISFGGGAPDSYLYRYDGVNLQAIVRPTPTSGWGFNPFEPTAMAGDLYFTDANDLWRTDGSSTAVQVADPALPAADLPRSKRNLAAVGDTLFFAAAAGSASGKELWTYKRGEATTAKVEFIGNGYYPAELTAVGNRLFFVGDDSLGAELWISDGTAAGTNLVRDINPSAGAGAPGPRRGPTNLTAVNDRLLYFSANDGSSGYELWRSDGTAAGTSRVLDINPGAASSYPRNLIVRGNVLYFTASDSSNGRQLWATDTLTNSTSQLTSIGMLGPSSQFTVQDRGNDPNLAIAGETLFLSAYSRVGAAISGYELWGLDLPPLVSLKLAGGVDLALVQEDGSDVVRYVFERTGDTSGALTVEFRVTGTAVFGGDYSQSGADNFSTNGGSITFAAGASTAFLMMDPNVDELFEGYEPLALALMPGPGYSVASEAEVVAGIVDGDWLDGALGGSADESLGGASRTPIPPLTPRRTSREFRNDYAFAALKNDGSVISWGDSSRGGDSSSVAPDLSSDVIQIFSNGESGSGAFAALKRDGSVITWGSSGSGGDSSGVRSELQSGVIQISSTANAFAALKSDGSVVTWGVWRLGGEKIITGSPPRSVAADLTAGVSRIFSTAAAFAALKSDGSVITWGDASNGAWTSNSVAASLSADVVDICSTESGFAALKRDGSLITWGNPFGGGDSSTVVNLLGSGVTEIAASSAAFAALKSDGTVVTWGTVYSPWGAASSPGPVQLGTDVIRVVTTKHAFAALQRDGSVLTWGDSSTGGDSSAVAAELRSGVSQLVATGSSFAALKRDGSVISWGDAAAGGNSSAVANQLRSGVTRLFANDYAFAALKSDGSVVPWGTANLGGTATIDADPNRSVASQLSAGVVDIFSTTAAFSALKSDGSVVSWGSSLYGGDSAPVANQLSSGVLSFADPFHDDRRIPFPYTAGPISIDGVNLGSTEQGYALRVGSGRPLQVSYPGGNASASNPGNGWSAVAAARIGGGYHLYWGNAGTGQGVRWQLDSNATYSSGIFLTPSQLISEEGRLNLDLNADGYTSGPISIDGVNLGSTGIGYALRDGSGAPLQVTYPGGNASASNPGNGWSAVAAARDGSGGYHLYWSNSGSGQAVRWQLNSAAAYTSGIVLGLSQLRSEEAKLNLDLNGDGYTSGPTTIDGVNLGSTTQGDALQVGSAAPLQLSFPGGNVSASNPGNGWRTVAASSAGSGYHLYWHNSGSGQTVRWLLNSSGAYISGIFISPSELSSAEAQLNTDLNADGYVSGPVSIDGVNLGSTADGYALRDGAGPALQVTYPSGNASASNPGNGWSAVAAARTSGGYHLYWSNSGSRQAVRWQLDGSGSYVTGNYLLAAELISEEARLNLDLNGDGYTSGPTTINAVNLGSTADGYALRLGSGETLQVSFAAGNASASNPGNGWRAVAASSSGDGYGFYWHNSGSGQTVRWQLDSNGAYSSGAFLSASQLISEEDNLNFDLNGDAIIGSSLTAIETLGTASLLRRGDGLAAVRVGGTVYPVSSPFGLGVGDASSTWQMLAAETVGGQNQILWRNNPGNFLHVWSLNSNWSWQSSFGTINPSSIAGLGLETNFQLDLNGDGVIG